MVRFCRKAIGSSLAVFWFVIYAESFFFEVLFAKAYQFNASTDGALLRVVAIADSAAPGVAGAVYSQFYPPFIGPNGQICFAGKVDATSNTNDALWLELDDSTVILLAQEGDQPEGVPDGHVISELTDNFSPFLRDLQLPVVDGNGRVIFNARLNSLLSGTWYGDKYGQFLVGYQNQPAPLYGDGRQFSRFDYATRMNRNGEALLLGGLESPAVSVVWRTSIGDTLELVDSTGMQLPGYPQYWVSGGSSNLVLNDDGSYACIRQVKYITNPMWKSIFSDRSGSISQIYSRTSPVPGFSAADSFGTFDWLRMNRQGHLAFYATTFQGTGSNNRTGLWAEEGGALQLVALLNAEAPGTPLGVKFLSFTQGGNAPDDIYYTDADEVVFLARLTGTDVTLTNDAGVWRKRNGTLELLAREGDEVAGADSGITFDTIERLFVNGLGDVLLFATIKGPGVTANNNQAFWILDNIGNFTSVVRTGDQIQIAPGVMRTFYRFWVGNSLLGNPSTGADGKPMIFNDRGQLAFQAWFLVDGGIKDAIVTADLNNFLSPLITLENPAGGELWRASEQDTIRWTHTLGGSVNLFYCTDFDTVTRSGRFDPIVLNYPADSGWFAWNIPDTIISKRCVVVIRDAYQSQVADTSGVLKIKGYIVTRDSAGQWEPFRLQHDAWSFDNSEFNMFPLAWYLQFDYQNGFDPFTPVPTQYPQNPTKPFWKTPQWYFPDWPSFVRAYGLGVCYLNLTPGHVTYRPSALVRWASSSIDLTGAWGGSCFGFAISSLLAFDDSTSYRNRYPLMPPFTVLHDVPIGPETRNIINELWIHQTGEPHAGRILTLYSTMTPSDFVKEVKALFGADTNDYAAVEFFSNDPKHPGGHAVVAYRAVRDTLIPGYWVYVYDNNTPGFSDARIRIDTAANGGDGEWTNAQYPTWGGAKHLMLIDQASSYLTNATRRIQPAAQFFAARAGALDVYPSKGASVLITTSGGDSLGYSDSLLIQKFPGAQPVIAATGFPSAPYAYRMPGVPISVRMERFADSLATLSVFADSLIMTYSRSQADSTDTDLLHYDGSLAVTNVDPVTKEVSVQTIIKSSDTEERVVAINKLTLSPNDSLRIENTPNDYLKITQTGSSVTYNLFVERATSAGNPQFSHESISLEGNSSHIIAPDWSDLGQPVRIYIDESNDGSIDDSINIVTGIRDDRGALDGKPSSYVLSQNFPNPFNSTTMIEYGLPVSSQVTLTVYDLLGREIATLVDEYQSAGFRQVLWDASGVPSGVYYIRMTAGVFTETRKVLLMR